MIFSYSHQSCKGLLFFFSFILFLHSTSLWAEGTITQLKTQGPTPPERDSLGIANVGSNIYLFGGVRDDFNTQLVKSYNDLYRFDTKTNTWVDLSPKGNLPAPRGFSSGFGDAKNGMVYFFGGTSFSTLRLGSEQFKDLTMFNDLWAYSINKNTWTQIQAKDKGPVPRAKSIGWIANGKIYVFGGVSNSWNTLNDLWVYDIAGNSWSELIPDGDAASPVSRQEAVGGLEPDSKGNLAVIYGGESIKATDKGPVFSILNDTWEYNIKTNKWTNITPVDDKNIFPTHTYSNAAIIGNYLYLQSGDLQGVGSTSDCGAPFPQSVGDDLWKFDLTNHTWSRLGAGGDALPRMKRTASIAADNKMYMFFGYDFICDNGKPGQMWIKNVYMYKP